MLEPCHATVIRLLEALARGDANARDLPLPPGGRLARALEPEPRAAIRRLIARTVSLPEDEALEAAPRLPLQNETLSEAQKHGVLLLWHVVRRRGWQALCDNTSTFYRYRRAAFAQLAEQICAQPHTPAVLTNYGTPEPLSLIGREAELHTLLAGLAQPGGAWVVEGQGGLGKTVLAQAVIERCLAAARAWDTPGAPIFAAVVWASARDGELGLPRFLDLLARVLDYPGLLGREPSHQALAVRELLGRVPTLVVIDDCDQAAREVLRFALDVPAPSRVMLTARTRLDARARVRVLSLGPLAIDDTLALLRAEGTAQGLAALAAAPEAQLRPLAEAVQGWPLLAVWSTGQVRQGQTLERICEQLRHAQGPVFDDMLGRTLARLSDAALQVLHALAGFSAPASRAAIVTAAAVASPEGIAYAESGLDELLGVALVDAGAGLSEEERLYGLHPITRQFVLGQDESPSSEATARALAFYARMAQRYGGPASNWRRYARIERELPALLALVEAGQGGDYPRPAAVQSTILELSDGLRNFFRLRAYWREGLAFFHTALAAARALSDARAEGWNLYRLAYLHFELGTGGYREAGEWAGAAIAAFRRAVPPDLRGVGHATRILGRAARERGDFARAWHLLDEALVLLAAHGRKGDVAITRASQADLLRKQGRLDEAEALYREVLPPALAGGWPLAGTLADPSTLANVLHNLGDIALRRDRPGDRNAAAIWFQHGHQAAAEAGVRRLEAECLWGLAQVARAQGEVMRAEALGEQARELFERLGGRMLAS